MPTQAAAQQIENWPIERLIEYPRNPRKNDKSCGSDVRVDPRIWL
jgi:hypothetical protein